MFGHALTRTLGRFTALAFALVAIGLMCGVARADYTVDVCGQYYNDGVFSASLPAGGSITTAGSACPSSDDGGGLALASSGTISASDSRRGAWQADAPAGLEIVAASSPQITPTNLNAKGYDWGSGVYWSGGGQQITDRTSAGSWYGFESPYFGFQLVCGASSCKAGTTPDVGALLVQSVALSVRETTGPSLTAPSGLWQHAGWVRGQWPLTFSGSSPSGICGLNGTLNDIPFAGTTSARDVATWHQCSAAAVSDTINTAAYGQGAMPLYMAGYDAAGRTVSYTRTVEVDNSTPTLSMAGPIVASTASGAQYVTATATGSPSGIDGISCRVDGAPAQWYPGATAKVPVSGVGAHQVSCQAYDNAVEENGVHGISATRSWSMRIGQPTALGVAFFKYAGVKCKRVRKRVLVPGHWVTRRHHGKRVRVKTKPTHKIRAVTKCRVKTKRVRVVVRVPERRHGKLVKHHGRVVYRKKVEHKRVPVKPHLKALGTQHVKHGRSVTVSGWLGLTDGVALGGRTVQVMTAPDNGRDRFSVATTATTAADGVWSARVPAGPSRLIEASYGGDVTTLGTASGQIKEVVPARIELQSVSPTRVAWGRSVTITGKLLGGYLPRGGVNVRLRLGRGKGKETFGVKEHVAGDGRFKTTYTFGVSPARDRTTYWFEIATLPSGNYPYAPSHSGKINVRVGGHPRHHAHRRH